jgi:ABC-type transport system substrate-binding protein
VTDLIAQALATVDQKKREQLYIEAQKITNEDAPYVSFVPEERHLRHAIVGEGIRL